MDRTETGLQGQTTPDERSSGKSEGGYNCNLELVGQFQGEGAFSQDGPAFLDNCAYYATENRSGQKHPGVVVLDVSDPRHPQPTAYLDDTPAGRNPHETLKVNEARKLLAVAESNGPNFAVYDLSADCRHPVLKSSITLPGSQAHMGGWAPDGKTYYVGQNNRGIGGTLPVVDVTDPSNAKLLLTWKFTGDGRPHDVNLNASGTRLYAGQPGTFGNTGSSVGPDGLVILDVSDIQARRPIRRSGLSARSSGMTKGRWSRCSPSPRTVASTSSARTSRAAPAALGVSRPPVTGAHPPMGIRRSSTSRTRRNLHSSPNSGSK